MIKRISIAAMTAVMAMMALLLPGTPASACKLGCLEDLVSVSPHSGYAGSFRGNITMTWVVTNDGGAPLSYGLSTGSTEHSGMTTNSSAYVALSPGSTGCAAPLVPYVSPTSAYLDPGESVVVTTYHRSQCLGSATVYLSAGQDQGYQTLTFY